LYTSRSTIQGSTMSFCPIKPQLVTIVKAGSALPLIYCRKKFLAESNEWLFP
jgi:hypothetical protein